MLNINDSFSMLEPISNDILVERLLRLGRIRSRLEEQVYQFRKSPILDTPSYPERTSVAPVHHYVSHMQEVSTVTD